MKLADYWHQLGWAVAAFAIHRALQKALETERNTGMNVFLKACLKEVFDLEQAGAAALSKTAFAGILPLLIQTGEDIPSVIANWATAKAELEALLKDPSADADLIAYGISLGWTSDKKVQLIIGDVAALVLSNAQGIAKLLADLKA